MTENSFGSLGGVFTGCTSLRTVRIGKNVSSFFPGTFFGCAYLETVTVDGANKTYHSAGNCLIETGSKVLIWGGCASVIPSDGSVTAISGGAFWGRTDLKTIVIPEGIISIGELAFYGCTGLESVVLAKSIKKIGGPADAFYGCGNIKSVYYQGTAESWAQIVFAQETSPILKATRYDYSGVKPTASGNYWHYGDGGEIAVW